MQDRIEAGEFDAVRTGSLREYRDEERRKRREFKLALEVEHGLVGHRKADLLFDLAWQFGHSYGLNDVAIYYGDIAELLKGA